MCKSHTVTYNTACSLLACALPASQRLTPSQAHTISSVASALQGFHAWQACLPEAATYGASTAVYRGCVPLEYFRCQRVAGHWLG